MSKTLLRSLIVALLVFACSVPSRRSQAFDARPDDQLSVPKRRVEVTFDGLMVFQKVHDHYEVGILGDEVAPGHKFEFTVGGKHFEYNRRQLMAASGAWKLEVVTSSGSPKDPDIEALKEKDCSRLRDTIDGEEFKHVFDFCWITDLEREFHADQKLNLIEGHLRPIILLNHGKLYTKFKYDQLEREQSPGGNTMTDFGFVAETIALRVDLREGEHLVLTAGGTTVFSLPTGDGESVRTAGIFNAPITRYHVKRRGRREESHFPYYYKLFSNLTPEQKVDIQPKKDGLRPLNRWFYPNPKYRMFEDDIRIRTFDNMACGAAFLGKRTDPLK